MMQTVIYESSDHFGPDLLMYLETLSPLIAFIVVALVVGWIATTWLKIKNGYPLHDAWGNAVHPKAAKDDGRSLQLTNENASLREDLSKMRDRLANVERIVTDSGYELHREFDRIAKEKDSVQ